MDVIVSARDVSFSYKNKVIFSDLSLNINKNSITSIIGSNNSGKTTLIKVLSGVLPITGNIIINNRSLNKKNARKNLLDIGIVFSDIDRQFLFSKAIDELRFPLENLMFRESDIEERIREIVSIIGIDNILLSNIADLSYYQKILVIIAVTIIHKPKVLFIDDIFEQLDDFEKENVFRIFNSIKNQLDLTIVFATCDLNLAMLSDDIFVLNDGKIVFTGTFDQIIEKDNELAKIGIIVPMKIDLCLKLKFYNLLDKVYLNIDEVVDKLWH